MGIRCVSFLGQISQSVFHVLTSDVLERRLLPDRKLYTKRLILKRGFGKFPAWIRRFASGTKELIVEESLLDMHSQNLRVVTRNVGSLGKYATVIEYCAYTPNTLPGSTVINRALNIESNLNYTIRSPLIYFLSHRYRSTAKGALAGYEYVCNLYKERSPCTHPDSSRRPSATETFVNATKHRTKEARDFASNSLPRVVRADSGNFRDH
ncbi:unnamed protein product [Dicrocoelium dendriticum]|nr:unnamed protein product [Dicrocoelium dendriticum]